jgi:hypothetical protein
MQNENSVIRKVPICHPELVSGSRRSLICKMLKQVQHDVSSGFRLYGFSEFGFPELRFCILQIEISLALCLLQAYVVEHAGNQILPPNRDDLDTLAERLQCFNQMTGNLYTCLLLSEALISWSMIASGMEALPRVY